MTVKCFNYLLCIFFKKAYLIFKTAWEATLSLANFQTFALAKNTQLLKYSYNIDFLWYKCNNNISDRSDYKKQTKKSTGTASSNLLFS